MLERIRIVLVRPRGAMNLGATCRAMMNMGLSDLVLVAPHCKVDDEGAIAFATRAASLLTSARIVNSIAEAVHDCVATFATSGKGGFHRQRAAVSLDQAVKSAVDLATGGPVAFAFGPEDRGLLQEEILEFDRVVEIPADPVYPVLNLAAAVLVVAYELRRATVVVRDAPQRQHPDPPADDARKRAMFEKLFASLEQIGFFSDSKDPNYLKYALRRVLGRADLSVNEADILIGLAQQIARAARGKTD